MHVYVWAEHLRMEQKQLEQGLVDQGRFNATPARTRMRFMIGLNEA